MRLIGTIENAKHGRAFSLYLAGQGIPNQCEIDKNDDWGSEDYGQELCSIWIIDEEQIDKGREELELFKENPDDQRYELSPNLAALVSVDSVTDDPADTHLSPRSHQPAVWQEAFLTFYTLFLCIVLFLTSALSVHEAEEIPPYLPPMAIFSGPVLRELLFDFPERYEIAAQLNRVYGTHKLLEPDQLPEAGKVLLNKFHRTKRWEGLYTAVIQGRPVLETLQDDAPLLMEKIRQGQWWRLVSPCLLHADILHLLFNMLWLVVLGRQIEPKIGKPKYLLLMLLTGAISNVAQYLMSGADFLGFSGIVCAMLGFIWMRQRQAPWEGYRIDRSTFVFISAFVLGMMGLQLGIFFLQWLGDITLPLGIANTAHVIGGLAGIGLGRLSFFRSR